MRTRLLRLGLAAVLPLVIAPLTNLPAAHADEDAGVGYWRNMPPRFAQRQKAGAALGVLEDDKTIDPDKKGGTVSFNPTNMETTPPFAVMVTLPKVLEEARITFSRTNGFPELTAVGHPPAPSR